MVVFLGRPTLAAPCVGGRPPRMRNAINTRKRTPKQIPFADAVLSLLGRRRAALDLIEGIESIGDGIIDTLDAAELPLAEPTLLLQKMENRLVRHHLETPDVLSSEELRKLRYILSFARLADFEPGAAGPGGTRGRGGGSVGAEIAPWRARGAGALYGPLLEEATCRSLARSIGFGMVAALIALNLMD